MKYGRLIAWCLAAVLLLAGYSPARAQSATTGEVPLELVASSSAVASPGATATAAAQIKDLVPVIQQQNITEPTEETKGKLVAYLEANPPQPLSWNNVIEHAIRYAVSQGVQPNVIVLVLLFPLVASFVAASRHIIGLRGFGIYIPAVLSVALVSTGVLEGIMIFLAIVVTALFTKRFLKRIKIPYLPRTGLLIWTISLGILALLILVAPLVDLVSLMTVNIFPILILVLLSENFLDVQASTKPSDAIALTAETIGLALICGFILKWGTLQRFALLEPELLLVATAGLNILVGKFAGLRLSERLRFRSLIEEE